MRISHAFLWGILAAPPCLWAQADRKVDFLKDVQPVLLSRCQSCHFGEQAQGGLRVHTREDLLRGGNSGPAIVPGNSGESRLVQMISGQQEPRMPFAAPALTEDTVAIIRAWVDQGAQWEGPATAPDRLAPIAPRKPPLPPGSSPHPADRFTDAYFRDKRIDPPRPVSGSLFARRAYFDLWGFPPTPEELATFVSDPSPDKRAALIDRLLQNRDHYAEHWITFWNDLLRNDEGVAYHGERKSITEWLLRALRENQPYDRMVQALLNPGSQDDPDGFLIGVTWRGVLSASQSPPMQAAQNSAQVFLGVNLKCAACHDSFVDRWKLQDTYGLAAMFSNVTLELVRCDVPTGQTAEPRFPIAGMQVPFDESLESRRSAAAEWFTTPENGRFARTVVNRYWKRLFGHGLVEPVDNMDAEPWHPDLLDWLAWDFAQHGYDLHHLLRRVMTSRAYQLPAGSVGAAEKEYVFRGPGLRRLTAEQFQDAISSVSGAWRVRVPRNEDVAEYTREWRLKSDALSRALGRPIRDQVYTERSTGATTLQALELTNGPLLSKRLERAVLTLLGELRPAPVNRFDSKEMRRGAAEIDLDISGDRELWLVIIDVDSYDPSRVVAGWAEAELIGPSGAVHLQELFGAEQPSVHEFEVKGQSLAGIRAPVPSSLSWDLEGMGLTRFRAQAVIDDRSGASDIRPVLRFFVFSEKPDLDRLVRIEGTPTVAPATKDGTSDDLVRRLYLHLLSREPTENETSVAGTILRGNGNAVTPAGLEDLLWALLVSPEFQFLH